MPAMNGRYSMDFPSHKGYERTQSLDRSDKGYKGSSIDNGLWRSEKLSGIGTGSLGMYISIYAFGSENHSLGNT